MKFDPQKAYPYPVLRPSSDDFGDVEFQTAVDYSVGEEKGILKARIEFVTSSDDLVREIASERAAYFAVFACRNTYFRKSFLSKTSVLEVNLDLKNLRDEVTVEPYIVATHRIDSFHSSDVSTEFGEGPFKYEPGHILAQDEHQSFYIDRDVFRPITSVFDLVKKDTLVDNEWRLSFGDEHVQIEVSPSTKERIDSARSGTRDKKAVLMNSIYFSAVMQAIQNLQKGEEFDGYKWAEVFRRKAHNEGIDLSKCDAYYATEQLMKFPLSLLNAYVFKGD